MKIQILPFDEQTVINILKHYLPEQASLKDFVHQNTLQAFQKMKFGQALIVASETFGYKVCLMLGEYRNLYREGQISEAILERVIAERKGASSVGEWKQKMFWQKYSKISLPRIGQLRANWKAQFQMDMDSLVHPILFRILFGDE